MSFTPPDFRPQEIRLLIRQIAIVGAEVSHSHLFLERYVRLLTRVRAQALNAINPPAAGDSISIRNEEMAVRIQALTQRNTEKTRLLFVLEEKLAWLLTANRSISLGFIFGDDINL